MTIAASQPPAVISSPLYRVKARRVHFVAEPVQATPVRLPARVAISLALAHRIQDLLDDGEVENRSDVASRLGVSGARITYLLALPLLAPDIQERVLALESVDGREPVTEVALRAVAQLLVWQDQRAAFERLLANGWPRT